MDHVVNDQSRTRHRNQPGRQNRACAWPLDASISHVRTGHTGPRKHHRNHSDMDYPVLPNEPVNR
jgi:hypothetical protein